MKATNPILGTIISLGLLIFVHNAFPQENTPEIIPEELCGGWVNRDYDETEKNVRWDFYPDGTWASYRTLSSRAPRWSGSYIVSAKWTDSEENTWFKVFWQDTIERINGYGLICIDQSGNTMESAHSSWYYPSKIDRELPFWHYAGMHHRKQDP